MLKTARFVGLTLSVLTSCFAFGTAYSNAAEVLLSSRIMSVQESTYGFKNVKSARISLYGSENDREATRMSLEYETYDEQLGLQSQKVELEVKKIEKDSNGVKHIYANLPVLDLGDTNDPRHVGARFSVYLKDYTQDVRELHRTYFWEASVRQGYGWCGTMDSTMILFETPLSFVE